MASVQPGLKAFVNMIGFALATILLTALVGAGPAAAQGNTWFGFGALQNIAGANNSAFGLNALSGNEGNGSDNTASGAGALFSDYTGSYNTASGLRALFHNTTGNFNTASGAGALFRNTTGINNIGLGDNAGSNIVGGRNNIEIGNLGVGGDESNTIRIGTPSVQAATFIAGIFGKTVNANGVPVLVDNTGKLGVVVSSARYKRDIHDMGAASAGLMRLRPVTFRYKNDPSGTLQYGLVAEEVARVYPELATRGTDGKVQSVRYLELSAMLLNELQKQTNQLQKQTKQLQTQARETRELTQRLETKDRQLAAQQREIEALKQQTASFNALSERLAALEQEVHTANAEGLRSLARK